MSVFDDTRKLAEAIGLKLPHQLDDTVFGIVVRAATARLQENWAGRVEKDDAFTPAAIDKAARDQERYDAGWNAGYDAAEAKRMPIVEAYALVAADLEREGRDTADWDVINALLEVRERLTKMEEGK